MKVNPYFARIVGYSREELQALTFEDITHPGDRASDEFDLRQLLAAEISTLVKEKRYIHKNGSIVWIKLTATLVRDDNNQPAYFIGVIEDISQRKQTELALQESETRFYNIVYEGLMANIVGY